MKYLFASLLAFVVLGCVSLESHAGGGFILSNGCSSGFCGQDIVLQDRINIQFERPRIRIIQRFAPIVLQQRSDIVIQQQNDISIRQRLGRLRIRSRCGF